MGERMRELPCKRVQVEDIWSYVSFAQPVPTSTPRRSTVSRCVSVIRSVERMEMPSTKQLII